MKTNKRKAFSLLLAVLLVMFGLSAAMAEDTKKKTEDESYQEEEDKQAGVHFEEENQVLDKATIQKVIKKRQSGILNCYNTQLQTNHSLAGKVVINFTIQLDGTIQGGKAVKKATTMKDKKVVKCIEKIVKNLHFPSRKKGEPIEINYPWVFQPPKE